MVAIAYWGPISQCVKNEESMKEKDNLGNEIM